MPLQRCTTTVKGKKVKGWQWGTQKCFTGALAKKKALAQAIAIGQGKFPKDDMKFDENKELAAQVKKQVEESNKKPSKTAVKTTPTKTLQKRFKRIVNAVLKPYIEITNTEIKPRIQDWINSENPLPEIQAVNTQYARQQFQQFVQNEARIRTDILQNGEDVNVYNKRKWEQILKNNNVKLTLVEPWLNAALLIWEERGYQNIKGMVPQYVKEIEQALLNGIEENKPMQEIAKNLTKINRKYANSRAAATATTQVNQLNAKLTQKRQTEAGITRYNWRTQENRHVRGNPKGLYPKAKPSHHVLNTKLCKWSDPTVYSDNNGKTWKKKSSIGGVEKHPGQDYNCQCFAEPDFSSIGE